MCTRYNPIHDKSRLQKYFGMTPPAFLLGQAVWPGKSSAFIRKASDPGDTAKSSATRETLHGSFGLVPSWAVDTQIARQSYNARSETVAEKPCFREAWHRAQRCIIPIESFYEPDWRSGKAVPVRIAHAEGAPLGIAGLWSSWEDDAGELLHSFAMLTVEARKHPLINELHKLTDEKRMLLVLPPEHYDEWLFAAPKDSDKLLRHWPVELAITQ